MTRTNGVQLELVAQLCSVTNFFNIPTNRVVEPGTRVEILFLNSHILRSATGLGFEQICMSFSENSAVRLRLNEYHNHPPSNPARRKPPATSSRKYPKDSRCKVFS